MKNKQKAVIVLEDGACFEGFSFTGEGETNGEVVFNTGLSGYQEILTDPSYKGQIVTMTYPLIGNYGINSEDLESKQPYASGFVVKEVSRIASNWRSQMCLDDYLKRYSIIGIEGIDTRALTRRIRLQGAMKAIISTQDFDKQSLLDKVKALPGLIGKDLVKEVTCAKAYWWSKSGKYTIVVLDCGAKYSILRNLAKRDCKVLVVPANTKAEDILKNNPDGVVLSNGPGDPAAVTYVFKEVKKLLGKVPIFGICLGQQMLGLAWGGKTYKLKFGHHGCNHPVKDTRSGAVSITSQNHGFCVDWNSLASKDKLEITHVNLNDNTLEGFRHKTMPIFCVQFHPEAGPGPHDASYLFDEFINMINQS